MTGHRGGMIGTAAEKLEKTVRIFHSFEEADAAQDDVYLNMTPHERLAIVFELRARVYPDADKQRLERVYRVTKLGES